MLSRNDELGFINYFQIHNKPGSRGNHPPHLGEPGHHRFDSNPRTLVRNKAAHGFAWTGVVSLKKKKKSSRLDFWRKRGRKKCDTIHTCMGAFWHSYRGTELTPLVISNGISFEMQGQQFYITNWIVEHHCRHICMSISHCFYRTEPWMWLYAYSEFERFSSLIMCLCVSVWVCAHADSVPRGQRRASDPWCCGCRWMWCIHPAWVQEIELGSSRKTIPTLS